MLWDSAGNKHYSSSLEALQFLQATTKSIVRWLHECRENGGELISLPHYRSLLNDIANVTIRWIDAQEKRISTLQDRVHSLEQRLRELEGPQMDQKTQGG